MDNLTPNMIFTAIFCFSAIIIAGLVILSYVRTSYEAAHKPVYREFKDD